MQKLKILLFAILNILIVGNVYAVTYNAEYMKDLNISVPSGTEAVSILDNALREKKRVDSYQYSGWSTAINTNEFENKCYELSLRIPK